MLSIVAVLAASSKQFVINSNDEVMFAFILTSCFIRHPFSIQVNWYEAQDYCTRNGMKFAKIETHEQQHDLVLQMMKIGEI